MSSEIIAGIEVAADALSSTVIRCLVLSRFAKLLDVLRRWWYGGRMKIDELDEFQGTEKRLAQDLLPMGENR